MKTSLGIWARIDGEALGAEDDIAGVVLFCLTLPPGHRVLETALRPMTGPSWG